MINRVGAVLLSSGWKFNFYVYNVAFDTLLNTLEYFRTSMKFETNSTKRIIKSHVNSEKSEYESQSHKMSHKVEWLQN